MQDSNPQKPTSDPTTGASRRSFIKGSSLLLAGGTVANTLPVARAAHAFGSDTIKIGLVGCGGRGTGAANQAMDTTGGDVRLTCMADIFEDRIQQSLRSIKGEHGDKVDVTDDTRYTGLEGYKRILDSDIDLVILATAPGFRPTHFEAAVEAGKHVFAEKPVATDAPGVRRVIAASEKAKEKNLAVQIGLQRHHEVAYRETIDQLKNGAIGDILFCRAYWNGGGVWTRVRQPQQTEIEYQLRNWYYFNWLCGDHIVEQHIHNLDVINWLMDGHPVTAQGAGGRQVRVGPDSGQIYDHHTIEYTYANGVRLLSMCRHQPDCWNAVSEWAHGTKGWCDISGGKIYDHNDKLVWKTDGKRNGHAEEHVDLFALLRAGEIPNEGKYGAESTMTSIMGRMATYSGKELKWDECYNSNLALADFDNIKSIDDEAPVKPDANGNYPIPTPGTKEGVL
ncbi:MAG: Gfo/Idh/MocA family oxidoreductase [Planctomycetales bacterium]|nr:Gfo/Idh/MocA family oxidoreductase [Planctomycetales bacterium]